jgi:hypothetical protein
MPLNGNNMGTEVKNAIEAEMVSQGLPAWDGSQGSAAEEFWQVICGAIVAHIQTHADVSVTVPVDTTDIGLQTTVSIGSPTGGPALPTSLDGTGGVS